MVSGLSLFLIVFNMLLGIVVPVGLLVFLKKKNKVALKSFFVGCGVMFLFAFILEQIVHSVILGSTIGTKIQENVWTIALYGGLMAGLFEETGRFLAMKFLLKKEQADPHNALMYGAGHGGFEMFVLLSIGMINNLIYAVMINTGMTELITGSLDEVSKATVEGSFKILIETPAWQFALSPVERFAAISAQIALSVIVWFAVTQKGKTGFLFVAILLHALLDIVAVILAKSGINLVVVEIFVWVVAILIIIFARSIWKKQTQKK